MNTATFLAMTLTCAPAVHVDTAHALVEVESGFNPWAIGVVGGALLRQPRSHADAIATAAALMAAGHNFSVGLAQINVRNFARLGLTLESAFEPCGNLAAMQAVLGECFDRSSRLRPNDSQRSLRMALSCYYSGNFTVGFRDGYVRRVVNAATNTQLLIPQRTSKEKS